MLSGNAVTMTLRDRRLRIPKKTCSHEYREEEAADGKLYGSYSRLRSVKTHQIYYQYVSWELLSTCKVIIRPYWTILAKVY